MWVQKVFKAGNSLGVVIPKQMCDALQINRGDFVVVFLYVEDKIIIQRLNPDEAKSLLEKDVQILDTKKHGQSS